MSGGWPKIPMRSMGTIAGAKPIYNAMDDTYQVRDQTFTSAEIQRMYAESAYAAGNRHPGAALGMQLKPLDTDTGRRTVLAMRLDMAEADEFGFDHISTAQVGDRVYVFLVQNDQSVTLTDARHMFPSDDLIAQLKLIRK